MTLEQAMRQEVTRLEEEINSIDAQLQKIEEKIKRLNLEKTKKVHDLKALNASFEGDKEEQAILDRLIQGQRKVNA